MIRDEENDQYLLILGARLQGPKTRQTGRTVKFTSKDLKNWKFEGDFWAPDLYTIDVYKRQELSAPLQRKNLWKKLIPRM